MREDGGDDRDWIVGVMALWLGLMRLAERAVLCTDRLRIAAVDAAIGFQKFRRTIRRWVRVMNMAANMLGSARPDGARMRAMRDLESLNPRPNGRFEMRCAPFSRSHELGAIDSATAIAILAAAGSVGRP